MIETTDKEKNPRTPFMWYGYGLLKYFMKPLHWLPRSVWKIRALISTPLLCCLLSSSQHHMPLLWRVPRSTSRTIPQLTLIRVHIGELALAHAVALISDSSGLGPTKCALTHRVAFWRL